MKLKKKTVKRLRSVLLVSVALVVMVSFVAIVTRLTLTPTVHPTFAILVVQPNRLIRIYGENFTSPPPNGVLANTLHIGNTTYEITSTDGYIIGTDVDVSRLPPGVYDCWITDPYLGNSNHVTLTIATPVPEFSSLAVVAFSALAASLYLLRRRRP
jgi:hypothetical protein